MLKKEKKKSQKDLTKGSIKLESNKQTQPIYASESLNVYPFQHFLHR